MERSASLLPRRQQKTYLYIQIELLDVLLVHLSIVPIRRINAEQPNPRRPIRQTARMRIPTRHRDRKCQIRRLHKEWHGRRVGPIHIRGYARRVAQARAREYNERVLVRVERLIDDVLVVRVQVDLVVVQVELERVDGGHEAEVVRGWAGGPVFGEVGEHVDVVTQDVDHCLSEGDGECPLALTVPFQGGGEVCADL